MMKKSKRGNLLTSQRFFEVTLAIDLELRPHSSAPMRPVHAAEREKSCTRSAWRIPVTGRASKREDRKASGRGQRWSSCRRSDSHSRWRSHPRKRHPRTYYCVPANAPLGVVCFVASIARRESDTNAQNNTPYF